MKSTRATEALVVLVACGDCTRTRQPSMRRDLAGQWEVVARPGGEDEARACGMSRPRVRDRQASPCGFGFQLARYERKAHQG